jgi:molybdate transport repressor ModE-like protein
MTRQLDRLTLLSTFVRIAERGSITAAAQDLGMSQASASRQLSDLEKRLGTKLIHRTTHNLALTETGEETLAHAYELLTGWEALAEKFDEETGTLSGPLKIVAPVALGQTCLSTAALVFQKAHPDVSITWLLDDAPLRFAETGCDLWIRIGQPDDDTLITQEVGEVERLIVAAPALTGGKRLRHPDQLKPLPCAALGLFEGGSIPLRHKKRQETIVTARTAIVTNNIFTARDAARQSVGYAVMPRWFVEDDLENGTLLDVLPSWRASSLTITASFLPSSRQTRRLRAILAHLVTAIQKTNGIASVQT